VLSPHHAAGADDIAGSGGLVVGVITAPPLPTQCTQIANTPRPPVNSTTIKTHLNPAVAAAFYLGWPSGKR